MANNFIKIGDLANMTGITVRTLHYYDEIGLLKPSQVTEKGHRIYNMQSVKVLYQIIAMKDMGFSLDEIKDLILSKDIDILSLIEIQLSNVQEEIVQKQQLFGKLLKLKERIKGNKNLSLEDIQEIVPFINLSADKFFTKEQLVELKDRLSSFNSEKEAGSEWFEFISKLKYCYKNKLSKTDITAIECIEYWKSITSQLIGEDEQMKNSIFEFHASQNNMQMRYGLTDELFKYLMSFMNN
ncbi:MerR family transcriptional regulator [Anaerocolumna aminovalerica]|jgi:DNA-binding transcriptional MerR regulator|uniref:MerR family transcriptional regulator n=1 Tax=Anaerocolumna aminovalerica TaxID=1527 RepID=UPI001C0EF5CA|nr:MerR family transcriptional regulator [Anaerocolumna aminovalerica]MBU5330871.1 MerR family transcriptional regulator [Anaerocolumna aminovalerica]